MHKKGTEIERNTNRDRNNVQIKRQEAATSFQPCRERNTICPKPLNVLLHHTINTPSLVNPNKHRSNIILMRYVKSQLSASVKQETKCYHQIINVLIIIHKQFVK